MRPRTRLALRLEVVEALDDHDLGLDALGGRAHGVAESEHHERASRARGLHDLQALPSAHPGGTFTGSRRTFSRPSSFMRASAQRKAPSRRGRAGQAGAEGVGQLGQPVPGRAVRGGGGDDPVGVLGVGRDARGLGRRFGIQAPSRTLAARAACDALINPSSPADAGSGGRILLVAEGHHRIHADRAARGQEAGDEGHREEDDGDRRRRSAGPSPRCRTRGCP